MQPADPVIINSIGMKLALIPAGAFVMGSPEGEYGRSDHEGPQHPVEITRSFYLGVFPVKQEEYEKVMGINPSWYSLQESLDQKRLPSDACDQLNLRLALEGLNQDLAGVGTHRLPVENVSWNEAVQFCRRLSARKEERCSGWVYRLPTEAEWEYACRAGTDTGWPSVEFNYGGLLEYHRDENPFLGRTSPVGSYPPNPLGLHDMHGNVREWCADWYDEGYYSKSPRKNPSGPKKGERRVTRGGGWTGVAEACRAAARLGLLPGSHYSDLGFRVSMRVVASKGSRLRSEAVVPFQRANIPR
jgi:formylglycine-generating enzyme required for sulfatase activity